MGMKNGSWEGHTDDERGYRWGSYPCGLDRAGSGIVHRSYTETVQIL